MTKNNIFALCASVIIHILLIVPFIIVFQDKQKTIIIHEDVRVFDLGMIVSTPQKTAHASKSKSQHTNKSTKSHNTATVPQKKPLKKSTTKNNIATIKAHTPKKHREEPKTTKKKTVVPKKKPIIPKDLKKTPIVDKKKPKKTTKEPSATNTTTNNKNAKTHGNKENNNVGKQQASTVTNSGIKSSSLSGKSNQNQKNNALSTSYRAGLQAAINQAAQRNYPNDARRNRQEGIVKVQFTLSPSGKFHNITIKKRSRYSDLNRAAVKSLKKLGGYKKPPQNFPTKITVPVRFKIRSK